MTFLYTKGKDLSYMSDDSGLVTTTASIDGSKHIQEFHLKLGVENRSTRAYHPMANGLVEAHNKILKRLVLLVNNLITNQLMTNVF